MADRKYQLEETVDKHATWLTELCRCFMKCEKPGVKLFFKMTFVILPLADEAGNVGRREWGMTCSKGLWPGVELTTAVNWKDPCKWGTKTNQCTTAVSRVATITL